MEKARRKLLLQLVLLFIGLFAHAVSAETVRILHLLGNDPSVNEFVSAYSIPFLTNSTSHVFVEVAQDVAPEDGECDKDLVSRMLVRNIIQYVGTSTPIHAVLMMTCHEACSAVQALAHEFGIIYFGTCAPDEGSNRYVSMAFPDDSLSSMAAHVIHQIGYSDVVTLSPAFGDTFVDRFIELLATDLEHLAITVDSFEFANLDDLAVQIKEISLSSDSRVLVYAVDSDAQAYQVMRVLGSSSIQLNRHSFVIGAEPWTCQFPFQDLDLFNAIATATTIVKLRPDQLYGLSTEEELAYTSIRSTIVEEVVSLGFETYAGCVSKTLLESYDALQLLALAVDEVVSSDGDISDSGVLMDAIAAQSFIGASGRVEFSRDASTDVITRRFGGYELVRPNFSNAIAAVTPISTAVADTSSPDSQFGISETADGTTTVFPSSAFAISPDEVVSIVELAKGATNAVLVPTVLTSIPNEYDYTFDRMGHVTLDTATNWTFADSLVLSDDLHEGFVPPVRQGTRVLDVHPRTGDPAGGQLITIFGSELYLSKGVRVFFGSVDDSSECVISSREHNLLKCSTPSDTRAGIRILVVVNGETLLVPLTYSYFPPVPFGTEMHTVNGRDVVSVFSSYFKTGSTSEMSCRYTSGSIVRTELALTVTDSSISCLLPEELSEEVFEVAVSSDRLRWSDSVTVFESREFYEWVMTTQSLLSSSTVIVLLPDESSQKGRQLSAVVELARVSMTTINPIAIDASLVGWEGRLSEELQFYGSQAVAVVGASTSTDTFRAIESTTDASVTFLSYGATDNALGSKSDYPMFRRIAVSDNALANATLRTPNAVNVRRVGLLTESATAGFATSFSHSFYLGELQKSVVEKVVGGQSDPSMEQSLTDLAQAGITVLVAALGPEQVVILCEWLSMEEWHTKFQLFLAGSEVVQALTRTGCFDFAVTIAADAIQGPELSALQSTISASTGDTLGDIYPQNAFLFDALDFVSRVVTVLRMSVPVPTRTQFSREVDNAFIDDGLTGKVNFELADSDSNNRVSEEDTIVISNIIGGDVVVLGVGVDSVSSAMTSATFVNGSSNVLDRPSWWFPSEVRIVSATIDEDRHKSLAIAVDMINENPFILPATKLVIDPEVYRPYHNSTSIIEADVAEELHKGWVERDVSFVVGERRSLHTVPLTVPSAWSKVAVVGTTATTPFLSSKEESPYFVRVVSSDVDQVKAVVSLVTITQGQYAVIIYQSGDPYENGLRLEYAAVSSSLPVVTLCEIDRADLSPQEVFEILTVCDPSNSAHLLMFIGDEIWLSGLIPLILEQEYSSRIVIGTDGWFSENVLNDLDITSVGTSLAPPFELNPIEDVVRRWKEKYGVIEDEKGVIQVIDAVMFGASAMHNYFSKLNEPVSEIVDPESRDLIMEELRNTQLNGLSGDIRLNPETNDRLFTRYSVLSYSSEDQEVLWLGETYGSELVLDGSNDGDILQRFFFMFVAGAVGILVVGVGVTVYYRHKRHVQTMRRRRMWWLAAGAQVHLFRCDDKLSSALKKHYMQQTFMQISLCLLEFVDVVTDWLALQSVLSTPELSNFEFSFTFFVTLGTVTFLVTLAVRLNLLRTIWKERDLGVVEEGLEDVFAKRANTRQPSGLEGLLASAKYKPGESASFTLTNDAKHKDDAQNPQVRLSYIKRQILGIKIGFLLLVFEDIPMIALNILSLGTSEGGDSDTVLLVATLVGVLMIGAKLVRLERYTSLALEAAKVKKQRARDLLEKSSGAQLSQSLKEALHDGESPLITESSHFSDNSEYSDSDLSSSGAVWERDDGKMAPKTKNGGVRMRWG